ncbi:MAG: hypothetical protein AAGH65_11500 [Pseudomonadota bacterium]
MRLHLYALFMLLLLILSPPILAQGITIGAGGSFELGSGRIDLGCRSLQINGLLALQSGVASGITDVTVTGLVEGGIGALSHGGNWTNTGSINPALSQISITDECGLSSAMIIGDSVFHDWTVQTSSGKQLLFEAGSTQQVSNQLVLTGSSGHLLTIRSTLTGPPGFLILGSSGSQFIEFVDVQDNHAILPGQFLAPGLPANYNAIDSGGNFRWFGLPFAIPALQPGGLFLLIITILAFAVVGFRRAI